MKLTLSKILGLLLLTLVFLSAAERVWADGSNSVPCGQYAAMTLTVSATGSGSGTSNTSAATNAMSDCYAKAKADANSQSGFSCANSGCATGSCAPFFAEPTELNVNYSVPNCDPDSGIHGSDQFNCTVACEVDVEVNMHCSKCKGGCKLEVDQPR